MRRLSVALLLVLVGCTSSIRPTPTPDVVTPTPSRTPSPSPTSDVTPTPAQSNELVEELLRIVRTDARMDAFLDRNPFQVDRVIIEENRVHLLLVFDGAIVGPTPWDITCSASFTGGPISGAHWIIDLEESAVVAFSPLWGDNSCAPLPEIGLARTTSV